MSNVSNKIEAAFVKGEIESLEFALSLCKKQTEASRLMNLRLTSSRKMLRELEGEEADAL